MPESVDPEHLRDTDDLYAAGREAFLAGASCLENPYANTGHIGRAWFAGWLDALADACTGGDRSDRANEELAKHDLAEFF